MGHHATPENPTPGCGCEWTDDNCCWQRTRPEVRCGLPDDQCNCWNYKTTSESEREVQEEGE